MIETGFEPFHIVGGYAYRVFAIAWGSFVIYRSSQLFESINDES